MLFAREVCILPRWAADGSTTSSVAAPSQLKYWDCQGLQRSVSVLAFIALPNSALPFSWKSARCMKCFFWKLNRRCNQFHLSSWLIISQSALLNSWHQTLECDGLLLTHIFAFLYLSTIESLWPDYPNMYSAFGTALWTVSGVQRSAKKYSNYFQTYLLLVNGCIALIKPQQGIHALDPFNSTLEDESKRPDSS